MNFLGLKYFISRYGFLSSFRPTCLTVFVSEKSFSTFFFVENTQFRALSPCQYFLAIHILDLFGGHLLAQLLGIFHILRSRLLNTS